MQQDVRCCVCELVPITLHHPPPPPQFVATLNFVVDSTHFSSAQSLSAAAAVMVDVSWYTFVLVPAIALGLLYLVCLFFIERPPPLSLPGQHVFITGGSSGVGLYTALHLVSLGCHVTIIARDKAKLKQAEDKIKAEAAKYNNATKPRVQSLSCDISDEQLTHQTIQQAESSLGPITILVHSAGSATPAHFEEQPTSAHIAHYSLNYLGAVHCLTALVPLFKSRGRGRIVVVSSLVGLSGIFGYTAYGSSKFALRGMAEALHMELAPYGIFVSVVCPPDTNTPGYENENKHKPEETKLISEGSGLFEPAALGACVVDVLTNYRFLASVGFDGRALCLLSTGTSPAGSASELMLEVCGLGVIRLISVVYRWMYMRIVRQVKQRRDSGQLPTIGASKKKAS